VTCGLLCTLLLFNEEPSRECGTGPHCGDEVDRHLPKPTKKLKKKDGEGDR